MNIRKKSKFGHAFLKNSETRVGGGGFKGRLDILQKLVHRSMRLRYQYQLFVGQR